MEQNHPCYVMVVCNKSTFINILTVTQYDYIKNVIMRDDPEFYIDDYCDITTFISEKVKIIRDAVFIHNFIDKLGFNIGPKIMERFITEYQTYLDNSDCLSMETCDGSISCEDW